VKSTTGGARIGLLTHRYGQLVLVNLVASKRDAAHPVPATGVLDEVSINVFTGRVEVSGVDQHRRTVLLFDVANDVTDMGL
jgi:hypothetical protein